MKELFENQDLSEATFRNVNLAKTTFTNANLGETHFDDVNLAGATIRNANLNNLKIDDAFIGGMTVSGMRIDQLIHDELDRRDPERIRLRMADIYDLECVYQVINRLDEVRAEFYTYLRSLDPGVLKTRPVSEEWSALECLRHLVFAEDLYLNRWLLQNEQPWCPMGLLPTFLANNAQFSAVGCQPDADLEAILAAWDELHTRTWQYIDDLTPEELHRDTSQVDFGQGSVAQVLQGLAQHDLIHIRQAQAAANSVTSHA